MGYRKSYVIHGFFYRLVVGVRYFRQIVLDVILSIVSGMDHELEAAL
jgi:hypothetical protein